MPLDLRTNHIEFLTEKKIKSLDPGNHYAFREESSLKIFSLKYRGEREETGVEQQNRVPRSSSEDRARFISSWDVNPACPGCCWSPSVTFMNRLCFSKFNVQEQKRPDKAERQIKYWDYLSR